MALPKYQTEQFPSSYPLICGGSILFASTQTPLNVFLLHHNTHDELLLPKGSKDRGEDVTATRHSRRRASRTGSCHSTSSHRHPLQARRRRLRLCRSLGAGNLACSPCGAQRTGR
ncbi:hypothetical protein EI94DRAFT_1737832 [Lactarius quietus]|nr:hypothetical protein EI94DRAFT_1737832 [Lactarius quietus]